ncbi:WXG100 family type VII secretion target [Streptomyces pinistramenti]|uniref:WXG100 family type VII secretion target n=1 Tax=Streptomyces pinistramenti TaxID=2884812 RepID=UPI001D05EED0|nr:type VII secretion target [Streptomyces pinistramenti]MCB5907604.1 ESX-1 secretion-associated protein [Streptomyces pinistramenti]
MSTDFKIDVGRIQEMLNKLAHADERMRDAQRRLNKVGPKALGTDGLDDACDEFQDQWGDGIKRIADAAKDIHEKLGTTLDAYKAGEEENAKMLGKK